MADIPVYMDGQDANLYQSELNTALQNSLSNNGWTTPQQSTATITDLSSTMPNGTIWYDSSTNEPKMLINGVVRTLSFT